MKEKKNPQSSLSLSHLWSLSLMPSHGRDSWAPPPLLAAAIAEATTHNIQRWSMWSPMATSPPSNSPHSHRLLHSFVHNNNNNSGLSQTEKEWTPMLLLLNLSKRERERERERDCRLSQIVVSLKVRVVKFKFLWFWGWFFFFFLGGFELYVCCLHFSVLPLICSKQNFFVFIYRLNLCRNIL